MKEEWSKVMCGKRWAKALGIEMLDKVSGSVECPMVLSVQWCYGDI